MTAAVAGVLGGWEVAEAQYLAVFVDGRLLKVTGAKTVGAANIRLGLPGGGSIDVPVARLDRVIADEVEAKPAPIPEPSCRSDYADQALPADTPFAAQIRRAGKSANLSPVLVAAVVAAESAFRPWAVSRVGAAGLMQLMPSVWLMQGLASPYEPEANLQAGCRHLRMLLDRFGDLTLALAAYNAGIATVVNAGGVPPYRETRDFLRRVLARFCPEGPRSGAG